jgi:hypothetical protein
MFRIAKHILLSFFVFDAAVAVSALPSDPRLVQMVPPESQVIASMLCPNPEGKPSNFLLITMNNRIDFEDFYAVTGADASRVIHQVVFVAAAGPDGTLSEHSLLVSGHFNRNVILRFAESGSARLDSYRGKAILVVPPLARERNSFAHLRWLAILNSNIAIFGTPASVQRELDREIANSRPDPLLMARLSQLDSQDETWCLLPVPSLDGLVQSAFEKLDPKLGAVARQGGLMQYGIHFGRRVEITASSFVAEAGTRSQDDPSVLHSPAANSLFGDSSSPGGQERTILVKVAQRRYVEWLAEFSNRSLAIGGSWSY